MKRLKGVGTLIYDPHRPGMKAKTDWWIIVNTDPEICRYYRWWVWRRYMIDLQKPAWGAHISILRGARPYDEYIHLWKKYSKERVEFEYSPVVQQSTEKEQFWFVDVWSKRFNEIREELGFRTVIDDKPIVYHLTVGRTY
jgi:hypothetical protein